MAIDPLREELFPLSVAVKFAPRSAQTGKYLSASTLYRWATRGLKSKYTGRRIYLETQVSSGVVTSREAIARFIKERSKLRREDAAIADSAHRNADCADAARELDAAGI